MKSSHSFKLFEPEPLQNIININISKIGVSYKIFYRKFEGAFTFKAVL